MHLSPCAGPPLDPIQARRCRVSDASAILKDIDGAANFDGGEFRRTWLRVGGLGWTSMDFDVQW